jgi:hypothetical protein
MSNILGIVSCVKSKLKRLVVGDTELTKRQYSHHNTTTSTPNATTATITIATTQAKEVEAFKECFGGY